MTGKTKDTGQEQVKPMQQESVKQSGQGQQPEVSPDAPERSRDQLMRQIRRSMGNNPDNRAVQRDSRGEPGAPQVGNETRAALSQAGGGNPLPEVTRAQMENSFGSDMSAVRVHTSPQADRANRELNANAFASGQDIYFAQGRYQPDTPEGKHLIAHELAHTVQQGDGAVSRAAADESPVKKQGADKTQQPEGVMTAPQVSKPGDRVEREAESAAKQVSAGKPVEPGTISRMSGDEKRPARQAADEPRASSEAPAMPLSRAAATAEQKDKPAAPTIQRAPADTPAGAAPPPPAAGTGDKGVSLASPTFSLPTGNEQANGSDKLNVPVYFGKLARGDIEVHKRKDKYFTHSTQQVPLMHPALDPLRSAKVEPVLAVEINDSVISGYITISRGKRPAENPEALMAMIKSHSREFGWAGIDIGKLPDVKSSLKDGTLTFQVENFPIKLGGFIQGTANFGLINEQVTFSGTANINVSGLGSGTLDLKRDEKGVIAGKTELEVALAKFSGKVIANFAGGVADIQGSVGYKDEKFSGEVTIVLVDAATADNLAKQKLPADKIAAKAQEMKTPGEDDGAPKPGPRKLAGYGTLEFALTDWLAGTATVIIDGKGNITVIGKIAPPAEKILFEQQDYSKQLVKVEVRAPYGIPVVGNVYLFANIALIAEARIGPAKIYKIEIDGTYSTDPDVLKELQLAASFNMSAYAGLKLRGEGGVGLEILSHDIKAGAGVNAIAGVKGYVDARPAIGYREKADPKEGKKGELFIKGHAELAAQPFLALSGDLFVEVDSPWWSPLPDKKWTWPLGQLEYPLPGQFGLGADIDYVLGSKDYPQIKFTEAKFDSQKFMTDIMREQAPKKSGKDAQDKPADFKESGDAKGVQQGGASAQAGGTKPGASADPGPAKTSVQPGGGKKDKKVPDDPKAKAEGEQKKQEALKGGKGVTDGASKTGTSDHDQLVEKDLEQVDKIASKFEADGATLSELETAVKGIPFKAIKSIEVVDGGASWEYSYTASPTKKKRSKVRRPISSKAIKRVLDKLAQDKKLFDEDADTVGLNVNEKREVGTEFAEQLTKALTGSLKKHKAQVHEEVTARVKAKLKDYTKSGKPPRAKVELREGESKGRRFDIVIIIGGRIAGLVEAKYTEAAIHEDQLVVEAAIVLSGEGIVVIEGEEIEIPHNVPRFIVTKTGKIFQL